MTNLVLAFRNFVKVPKKECKQRNSLYVFADCSTFSQVNGGRGGGGSKVKFRHIILFHQLCT
jgi:hypothetical protein